MKQYFLNLFVWLSQSLNVIFLAGHPDQTISARAYENQHNAVWYFFYKLINTVFFWQDDHCKSSYLEDLSRALKIVGRSK